MPSTLLVLSRLSARNAVKEQIRARGIRLSQFALSDITSTADDYPKEHPELIERAPESVRNDPKLRTLAKAKLVIAKEIGDE